MKWALCNAFLFDIAQVLFQLHQRAMHFDVLTDNHTSSLIIYSLFMKLRLDNGTFHNIDVTWVKEFLQIFS